MNDIPALNNEEDNLSASGEKRITLRLSDRDYARLKKSSIDLDKSMNQLIVEAVRQVYSGLIYDYVMNSPIVEGVDKEIFRIFKTEEIHDFYEVPDESPHEVCKILNINNKHELDKLFQENIYLITKRAKQGAARYAPGTPLPKGISVYYLEFVLAAKIEAPEEAKEVARKLRLFSREAITDLNAMREYLGLKPIS